MMTAAFYRRDVLVALGGFETALGDELSDVGIALAIQSLGRLHVSEPTSQLISPSGCLRSSPAGFAATRIAERLFCRSAAAHGWTAALAFHALNVAGETVRHGRRLQSLAGRAAAWLELGALRAYEQRLNTASDRLAELAELRASVRKPSKRARQKIDPAIPQRRAA